MIVDRTGRALVSTAVDEPEITDSPDNGHETIGHSRNIRLEGHNLDPVHGVTT